MVAGRMRENTESLRAALRQRTRLAHDRLDSMLAPLAVGDDCDYAAFLTIQYRIRAGIENWVERNPISSAPPVTSPLIAEDLLEMGQRCPGALPFLMPEAADPIGLAWVIGGSALGNKSLLARRRQSGLAGSCRFLEDTSTIAYFTRLLPLLEAPAPDRQIDLAALAAEAVFDAFLSATEALRLETAA